MDYISVKATSDKWGISERRIQKLCEENRIEVIEKFRNLVSDEITDQLLYFYQKVCKLKPRLAIALAIWYNKGGVELYLKR